MGSTDLPLPMVCPIPQLKLCFKIAIISIGSPPGVASDFTIHRSAFSISDTEFSSNVSEVSQLVQDRRGDIWVGCVVNLLNPLTKSVFRFDGEHFAFAGTEYDFDINNCFAIYEDFEGYLWFGGATGCSATMGRRLKK